MPSFTIDDAREALRLSPATVTVTGKGSKVRIIPLSSNAASIIARYAKICQVFKPEQTLFTNFRKEPLTRSGEYSGWFYISCPVIWKSLFGFNFVHTES